ncbi:MAG: aminotransferase class III-fold pyridoxal phosphate-dependent enzyme [Gemmatimonadales bacterium]
MSSAPVVPNAAARSRGGQGTDPLVAEYLARRPKSVALHKEATGYFAAEGATHFTRVRSPFRPYVERAQGSRKWDVDGNEYIDYVMGHGALVLGHGHPAVVEAVQRQAAAGLHFGDNHPLELAWASRIRRLMPAAERVRFFACGQEANLMAFRLARAFTGRRRILRFDKNYHGWADGLAAPGAAGTLAEGVTVIPANDPEAVERLLATGEFALVMIEAGGGYLSGRIPTNPEFYRALPELCRKHGTLFLLDEVVTGFRESASGWQAVLGIRPDLTALGKATSGGLPSGVLIGRADVMALFSPATPPARLVSHGGTWNAVPLTCAAGIAACDLYLDGEPQRVLAERAAQFRHDGNLMLERIGVSGRLYARSVAHIYLGPIEGDPADDTAVPTPDLAKLVNPAAAPAHRRLDLHLLHRGVASMRGEALIFSAAHTEADVAATVAALEDSLLAMRDEGTLPD